MQRRLTFLRHAMPEVDEEADPGAWPLSAAGLRAAAETAPVAGDLIASSPELKAHQTTALVTGVELHRLRTDARFREVDRTEPVHDDFRSARQAWVAGRLDDRHLGWERPDAAARRFHDGLLAHEGDHLVVGTHGMVLTAWFVHQGLIAPGDDAVAFWQALRFPDVIEVGIPLLRVRALLTDAAGRYILIRRTLTGRKPYWTVPGGGVSLADASPEAALHRELAEELGARADLDGILFERTLDGIRRERFYAAQLIAMDLTARSGPEFTDPSRGRYDVERVSPRELASVDLRPARLKDILLGG